MTDQENKLIIYQAENGEIELRLDVAEETVWASIDQISGIFDINKSNVSRHIKNIFEEGEIVKNPTVAKSATVEKREGARLVRRTIDFYSLDIILAVGFRARSTQKAIAFRRKANEILKDHITQGYTINEKVLKQKESQYLQAIADIKKIAGQGEMVGTDEVLDIVQAFSRTWFSLQSYDESEVPAKGQIKGELAIDTDKLYADIYTLRDELISRGEATELFAQEKNAQALAGIVGNVMQSAFGVDVYETLEEKAAHLLYFVVKNHVFNDGNKRTGAFCFVWFLRQAGIDFGSAITPEALTALTLLVAQSDPKDKDRVVGLILLMFQS